MSLLTSAATRTGPERRALLGTKRGTHQPSDARRSGSWPETPVHLPAVGHRLIDEPVQVRVIFLECLASVDGANGILRNGLLASRVKVGHHPDRPVSELVLGGGGGVLPFVGCFGLFKESSDRFVELD